MEIGVHEFELFRIHVEDFGRGMNVDMMGFGVGLHGVRERIRLQEG